MYGCESWTVKKAEHQRIDAFELWCWRRLLKSPLDCKEIQPVHSEGDQPWDFFGGNDAEAEAPVLWAPHAKSWLIGKDSDAGRDWGQEEKGMTEDEMAGWHHRLDGREFEWTPGVGDEQRGLVCCSSWGCKELDTTGRLNWSVSLEWPLRTCVLTCDEVMSLLEEVTRGRDLWSTCKMETRQLEAPDSLPCPWNVLSAHHFCTKSCFKEAALREESVLFFLSLIFLLVPTDTWN